MGISVNKRLLSTYALLCSVSHPATRASKQRSMKMSGLYSSRRSSKKRRRRGEKQQFSCNITEQESNTVVSGVPWRRGGDHHG